MLTRGIKIFYVSMVIITVVLFVFSCNTSVGDNLSLSPVSSTNQDSISKIVSDTTTDMRKAKRDFSFLTNFGVEQKVIDTLNAYKEEIIAKEIAGTITRDEAKNLIDTKIKELLTSDQYNAFSSSKFFMHNGQKRHGDVSSDLSTDMKRKKMDFNFLTNFGVEQKVIDTLNLYIEEIIAKEIAGAITRDEVKNLIDTKIKELLTSDQYNAFISSKYFYKQEPKKQGDLSGDLSPKMKKGKGGGKR